MKFNTLILTALALTIAITGCEDPSQPDMDNATRNKKKVALGEQLFTAKSLSRNGTMSCATCHDLTHAMVDVRDKNSTSFSFDGKSVGDRNAPTAAYAMFSPRFHFDSGEGLYIGGQFLDGRELNLQGQAKGPFINPIEMNMTVAEVVDKVELNSTLSEPLIEIYGNNIFADDNKAYNAIADSIALFEMSPKFSPFDSKYDHYLSGKATLTDLEQEGLKLFDGKALCSACHPATTDDGSHPLFTDYSYDNIGVPYNSELNVTRHKHGQKLPIDNGLGHTVSDTSLNGAFKVSTLRNIAVTGPYMHNGLFKDLKTVVHFYNTRDTDASWDKPEVPATINKSELGNLGLSDHEEDAIVAFLETLTDKEFK